MKTISLENAKGLEELGVERVGYFYHLLYSEAGNVICDGVGEANWREFPMSVPAYTADEIGEMLAHSDTVLSVPIEGTKEYKCYAENHVYSWGHCSYADTMADAMALMLIWLIENGHVKAEEL